MSGGLILFILACASFSVYWAFKKYWKTPPVRNIVKPLLEGDGVPPI